MKMLNNNIDNRNDCPCDQLIGAYHVIKKNTIARFTFGKSYSSFKNINEAFAAMSIFIEKRKDADKLTVRLLKNHW